MTHATRDRSWSTSDRGPPQQENSRFVLTVEEIGPKRALMRNGNLVCYDVPIARAGWMLYGPGEVPILPNPTSPSIYIERTRDELFSEQTIASFEGAAITNDHPDLGIYPDGVTPDNYRELSGGFAMNVRPGADGDEDVLLADLVITRREMIDAIQSGKREVSAGYDANYTTVRPGVGRQTNILANHIALVEKGRCGPRCAIGDHATQLQQEPSMADKTQGAQASSSRRRFSAEDLDALGELVSNERKRFTQDGGAGDEGIHVHVHTGTHATTDGDGDGKTKPKAKTDDADLESRVTRIEATQDAMVKTLDKIGKSLDAYFSDSRNGRTGDNATDGNDTLEGGAGAAATNDGKGQDDATKTQDSAALQKSWTDLASKAEIIVPGFAMPTFDAAKPRKLTVDSMCKVRGRVLELFGSTQDGAKCITGIAGEGYDLESMSCDAKALLFNAVHAQKASANNQRATNDSSRVPQHTATSAAVAPVSIADINAANRAHWANQSGKKA